MVIIDIIVLQLEKSFTVEWAECTIFQAKNTINI